MTSDAELLAQALAVARPRVLSPTVEVASVGAALLTAGGTVHAGVCIDAACGIGFCAEHAAIAAMVTAGESRVATIVAVDAAGTVLPPCGRCRELIGQIDPGNAGTRVLLPGGRAVPLSALMPEPWQGTGKAG